MRAYSPALAGRSAGSFCRAAQQRARERGRQVAAQAARVGRLFLQMRPQDPHALASANGGCAAHALVHDATERVDVGGRAHRPRRGSAREPCSPSIRVPGRDASAGSPACSWRGRSRLCTPRPCSSSRMLPGLMSRCTIPAAHSASSPAATSAHMRTPQQCRARPPRELLLEGEPVDESLRHVGNALVLPRLDHGHDVRMPDRLGDPRLALEAAPERLVARHVALDELQRHLTSRRGPRLVDPPHAAFTQQTVDRVVADRVGFGASPGTVAHRPASLGCRRRAVSRRGPIDARSHRDSAEVHSLGGTAESTREAL